MTVIFEASSEVRNSIVFATIIVILVFPPPVRLEWHRRENLLTAWRGVHYNLILASLVVSLTVTPALCYYLLPSMQQMAHTRDSFVVSWLEATASRYIWSSRTAGWPWEQRLGCLSWRWWWPQPSARSFATV